MRLRCIIDKDDLPKLIKGEELTLTNDKISAVTIEVNGTLTNGDVIKAMFPSVEVKEKNNGYEVYFGVGTAIQFFNHQWWNSPYKESDKDDR